MHWDILDDERKALLPVFAKLDHGFYLAGGTALALQLGHRDSIDFDFFTQKSIDTNLIAKSLVYFDDIGPEAIIYKGGHETDFEIIKNFLRTHAAQLF